MSAIMTQLMLPDIKSDKRGYGAAVDIGTTTVVVYLYDMGAQECLAVVSRMNDQTQYGLDVISRIQYCNEHGDGVQILQRTIVSQLNDMIGAASEKAGIARERISHSVVTGNTTMLHLLSGLSPHSLGELPFQPLSRFGESVPLARLGIIAGEQAMCYLPPCMSAFVGGDISCALLCAGFLEGEETGLLLDIGTNGEVVIGNDAFVYSTSTAAGPAFEGAHIRCGMAGVEGAVNRVYEAQGRLVAEVIGDAEAKGICGSGLLDATALMRRWGLIDETGKITGKRADLQFEFEGQPAFRITNAVFLTQQDVREIQMAKAAITAGILTLLHSAGLREEDIARTYIAGGFGNYMNRESAQEIGLLPSGFRDITGIGNAAGAGAVMALLNDGCQQEMQRICARSRHIELGHNPYFMEKYMGGMFF